MVGRPRRYLGIDPGTTRIGYGVIEEVGSSLRSLAWGIISNPGKDDLADKENTADALQKLVTRWKPDAAAVERLFFLNNKRSALAVSEMRGVIMLTLGRNDLVVHEFTPLEVKQQVCGHGGAPKAQIQRMVRLLLAIEDEIRPDDAADALALALVCATVRNRR